MSSESVFEQSKEGLEECIAHERGELTLRTRTIAAKPPNVTARKIVTLRKRLNMSLGVFASVLNISPKTVQSWEQGQRQPSQAALRLIQVIQLRPKMVCEAIGLVPNE